MTVAVSFLDFARAIEARLFEWQRTAFSGALERVEGRFRYRLAGISVPRGNGKSWGAALVGLWRLLTGRDQDLTSCALDLPGAEIVQVHARRIVQARPELAEHVEFRSGEVSVPSTGSRWTITSREHTASRGRHPNMVLYDECGWAKDDELFSSLLAGQASVADPLMLVISTVGRRKTGPLWTVKTLAEGGDPGVYWYHRSENPSPLVTADFLERQRRILVPVQYAREHQNLWVDGADGFATTAEIDWGMGQGWVQQHSGDGRSRYRLFADLGISGDPSVIATGHAEGTGSASRIYIDRLDTFQGTRAHPVQLADVEAALLDLCRRFNVDKIRIESWQGIASAQRLQRIGLPVEIFSPTPKAHAEEWPLLQQRLASRSIVLFPHARLREELLNLTVELGPGASR